MKNYTINFSSILEYCLVYNIFKFANTYLLLRKDNGNEMKIKS